MSDRRSFSEIPAELLRDHTPDARVERVWQRLETDVAGRRFARRPRAGYAAVLAVATFGVGLFVGARFVGRGPAPVAALAAEPPRAPERASLPAAAPSEGATVAAGDAPRARAPRHPSAARRAALSDTLRDPAPEPQALAPSGPAEWQRLADDGQYAAALAALEASGGFDAVLRDATAEQLMSLVDVARATGRRDRAIETLRRIVNEHGSDPNAPVAAWMLGNELAKTGDLVGAEQALAMYRALSPNGDFAEDALARQIDIASEQGNLEHARHLAAQYLKEFPDGPRSADMLALVERAPHDGVPAPSAEAEQAAPPASGTPPGTSAPPPASDPGDSR
jgi:TolA-binding protein